MIIFRKTIIEYYDDNDNRLTYEQIKKMENDSNKVRSPFEIEIFQRNAALLKQAKIRRLNKKNRIEN